MATLVELIVMEESMCALPKEVRVHLQIRSIHSLAKAGVVADNYQLSKVNSFWDHLLLSIPSPKQALVEFTFLPPPIWAARPSGPSRLHPLTSGDTTVRENGKPYPYGVTNFRNGLNVCGYCHCLFLKKRNSSQALPVFSVSLQNVGSKVNAFELTNINQLKSALLLLIFLSKKKRY